MIGQGALGVFAPLAFALTFSHGSPAGIGPRSIPATHQLVYLTQSDGVNIYDATAKNQYPVAQIVLPNGLSPDGLYVDAEQTLYVEDGQGVLGYRRGAFEPFIRYEDPYMATFSVCGTGNGTLFVPDGPSEGGAPADTIEVYSGRHLRPVETLFEYNAYRVGTCTADSSGDLFVEYETLGGIGIDEFPAGSTTPITLQTFTGGDLDCLALDAQRNLVVSSYDSSRGFQVFAPPYSSAPFRTFGQSDCSMAFDGTGKHLWSVELFNAAEFDYKNGRQMWYTAEIGDNSYMQLAVSPQLTP